MTVHQIGYNYHPNDRVWYFDPVVAAFKEGSCYQVEIKVYKQADEDVESKLTYLVALDDSPRSLRVKDSDLWYAGSEGLVQSGPVPRYFANYDYNPEDVCWVVDRVLNGVKFGTVYQSEIKIHKETETTSHTKRLYYVNFNDNSGTVIAKEVDVFATANLAWAALGISIGPTPTPIPTGTPIPGGGGGTNLITVLKVNSDSVTLYKGMPVYLKPNGTIARANHDDKALTFLGFVYDDYIPVDGNGQVMTEGVITATLDLWSDVVVGGTLTAATYYLNGLGTISTVQPSSGYTKEVGLGISSVELDIRIMPAYGI